jgi:hypothetical protein
MGFLGFGTIKFHVNALQRRRGMPEDDRWSWRIWYGCLAVSIFLAICFVITEGANAWGVVSGAFTPREDTAASSLQENWKPALPPKTAEVHVELVSSASTTNCDAIVNIDKAVVTSGTSYQVGIGTGTASFGGFTVIGGNCGNMINNYIGHTKG